MIIYVGAVIDMSGLGKNTIITVLNFGDASFLLRYDECTLMLKLA